MQRIYSAHVIYAVSCSTPPHYHFWSSFAFFTFGVWFGLVFTTTCEKAGRRFNLYCRDEDSSYVTRPKPHSEQEVQFAQKPGIFLPGQVSEHFHS